MKNALSIFIALFLATGSAAVEPEAAKTAVLKTLADYRLAMSEKSLEKLSAVVHPDLTVMEGVALNTSWADYRDNHIGPEMKEWKAFRVEDPSVVSVTTAGDWAYAVTRATYTLVFPDKSMVIDSAETFVLAKKDGKWLIRHIHSSGKKRPEAKP